TDLWMLFAARAASGFMSGNIAAAMAYVADVTRPEQRSRGMGLIGAAFGLGFIFGPIIGGLLGGPSASEADFRTPFLVAAGLSSVAVVMTLTLLRESWTADKRAAAFRGLTPAGRLAELGRALHLPVLGLLIVLFFIFTFVFAGMESTYALWAERRLDWGPRQVGTAFGVAGLLAALIQGGHRAADASHGRSQSRAPGQSRARLRPVRGDAD
ncbi:MAG: MFS transporter, partial [Alphaproteobacteria bacterium]